MKKLSLHLFYILGLISIFIGGTLFGGCTHEEEERDPNIYSLDSLLNHVNNFSIERLKQLSEIKQKRNLALSNSDKYLYDNVLFDNFYTLDADSAYYYANLSLKDAEASGNQEWIIRSKINKATLLAATGLLNAALKVMNEIDTKQLTDEELVEYYGAMIFINSHLGDYTGTDQNQYYVAERLYKDSIMNVIKPDHPFYLWYKAGDIMDTDQNPDPVIDSLEVTLKKSQLNDRLDAMNAYALARLYEQKGDMKNYEKYLALSAIVDVKIANAEISSMEDLAHLMFQNGSGDINRAYSYITYALEKAVEYPNRSKAFNISITMERINNAYQEKIRKEHHTTILFLTLVCVLAGILLISIVQMVRQNIKLKKQSRRVDEANEKLNRQLEALSEADRKLNDMNEKLKELNADLTKKNAELHEANIVKEEYIGSAFKLCSKYIADFEEFRRNIYLKAVKKQWRDIENISAELDLKEGLKEFYHSFDTIFLNLYPNFVNDFNALLKPGKQIIPKEGELLNMELRIYALVRLGISDSVKIADFLHCAPQTVYNYRLRTRSRAEFEKDDFLERVRTLGTFQGGR